MIQIKTSDSSRHAGMCLSSHEGHVITICPSLIEKRFREGYWFMGIKPETFSQALKIVLEHEICHVIMWYKDIIGHGQEFMELAGSYGHTDFMIRRYNEDSKNTD